MLNDKLELRSKMVGTYLIQRLLKPEPFNNPFSFGGGLKNGGLSEDAMKLLQGIFSFDYMGAAEFEFGAIPQTFRFLAGEASLHNLVCGELKLKENEVAYYLCPTSYESEVIERIKMLRDNKLQLHEWCGLDTYFTDKKYGSRYLGWLEIDNGYMFFADKEMWQKTCALFGVKIEVANAK